MSELTQRIKAKYPQYANVPDAELEKRVLQKYPQYKQYASKSIGGFVENIGKSGFGAVKDIVGGVVNVLNPDIEKNTLANLAKLGIDTVKLVGGDKSELNRASQVLSFYKQRYGGVDNIGETIYNDPVGFLLDASVVLGGAGAVVKGVGTAGKISGLTKAGTALSTAGAAIDPFMQAGKLAKVGTKRVFSGVPASLDAASESIATRGIGNPVAQAKAAKKAGRSVASFIDEYDLYDRSPESAGQAKQNIIGQYDNLALNSGKQLQMGEIVKKFNAEIERLTQGVGGVISDADKAKISELARRRDQLLQAAGGAVDAQGNLISSPVSTGVDTLTNFRRKVIDPDVPQSMFGLDARGSGSAQGVKRSRDIVKGAIDSSDPRLAKLGKDYGMAREMEGIFEKSQARANNRQQLNFTKLGSAGLGGALGGLPGAFAGYVGETIINDPRSVALQSKALKATAKTLGSDKTKKILGSAENVFSRGYSSGKTLRTFAPTAPKSTQQRYEKKTTISGGISEDKPYQPSITPSASTTKIKPLEYKQPKSVFANKSAFGSTKKVTRGSFY